MARPPLQLVTEVWEAHGNGDIGNIMNKEDSLPPPVSWTVLSAQGACPSPIAASSSTQEGTV